MTWALLWQNLARLWHTLAHSGTLWHTLSYSGILWHTLAYSGTLWHTLAYSGILWHTLQKHPEWAASNITIFIIVTFEDIYIKLYIKYPMLVFVVYFKYLYQMMFVVLFRCDSNLRKNLPTEFVGVSICWNAWIFRGSFKCELCYNLHVLQFWSRKVGCVEKLGNLLATPWISDI